MNLHAVVAIVVLCLVASVCSQSFPRLQLEILLPTGFRIAATHQDGMSQVIFNVNINKPINSNQLGDYSETVNEPSNGRWFLEDTRTMVYYSSKVNYWIVVRYGERTVEKVGSAMVSGAYMDISEPNSNRRNLTLPSGCLRSITTVGGKPVCKGELVFEDNFDTLDWSKWNREVRIPLDVDDAEFVSFQRRPENLYVRGGQLHIVPSLLSDVPGFNARSIFSGKLDLQSYCTGIVDVAKECMAEAMFSQILPPVVSARIRTRHFFSFRYGRVEISAKMPKGDWLIPLILLEPLENYYGSIGYASGQMRVASMRGNDFLEDEHGADISGKQISGGVVLSTGQLLRETWLKGTTERSHFGNDFHVYALTWTEDSIVLEVDGNRYSVLQGGFARRLRTTKPYAKHWENGHYMAPFDREFFLTLGVSVGGHSDFPDGCVTGEDRTEKPWDNGSPKAMSGFWKDRDHWYKTWNGENAGLHVEYIRVYAL